MRWIAGVGALFWLSACSSGGSTGGGANGGSAGATGGAAGAAGGSGGSAGAATGGSGGAAGGSGGAAGGSGGVAGGGVTIACGTTPECSTAGGGSCCFESGIASCLPPVTGCNGIRIRCDGEEDCTGSDVCCEAIQAFGAGGIPNTVLASCQTSCVPGGPFQQKQYCKTMAECTGTCADDPELPAGYKSCQ